MPNKCQAAGCGWDAFGGGYCYIHQYMRADKKAIESRKKIKNTFWGSNTKLKRKPLKRQKNDKRKEIEKKYVLTKEEFISYKKKIGEYKCIFCGEDIRGEPDIHHLFGRDGDLITNIEFFELADRECHSQYHGRSIRFNDWFDGFLERIKHRFPSLYRKELLKKDK